MKWIPALMLVLGACSRREEDATMMTGAQVVDASFATPREAEAVAAVQRWNRAMAQRDLSSLAGVYGVKVLFHGVPMRHDEVLQVLSDAFVKDPSFTQSIDDVTPGSGADKRVRLRRKWITLGESHEQPTWLELSREDGRLVVTAQGDATSDAREAKTSTKDRCEDLAKRVALSTKRANALLHAQADGQPNEARVAATPPEWPMYVVAVIDRTRPNAIAIGWFDVVPATGEVSDAFTGEMLEPSRDLIAEMRKCKP